MNENSIIKINNQVYFCIFENLYDIENFQIINKVDFKNLDNTVLTIGELYYNRKNLINLINNKFNLNIINIFSNDIIFNSFINLSNMNYEILNIKFINQNEGVTIISSKNNLLLALLIIKNKLDAHNYVKKNFKYTITLNNKLLLSNINLYELLITQLKNETNEYVFNIKYFGNDIIIYPIINDNDDISIIKKIV